MNTGARATQYLSGECFARMILLTQLIEAKKWREAEVALIELSDHLASLEVNCSRLANRRNTDAK